MNIDLKRQNFNITPEQEAELAWLREVLGASSTKDIILRAVRLMVVLVRELQRGGRLYVGPEEGRLTRVMLPELETVGDNSWKYLVARPHAWRRQLYVKGRRLLASTVWRDMQANEMTAEEAAENWDLSVEVIQEIIRYCKLNEELLKMEAEEERTRLQEGPTNTPIDSES